MMDTCGECRAYGDEIENLLEALNWPKLKAETFDDLEEIFQLLERLEQRRSELRQHRTTHE